MTGTKRKSARTSRSNLAKVGLRRHGPYRKLVAVPAGLRRMARAARPERARGVADLTTIAPSWLKPRFPLVNALLNELFRLERYGTLSDFYRPPRVSRGHHPSIRRAR
jgi:hypothetical protein